MKKTLLVCVIICLTFFSGFSQKDKKGHDIKINIKGWSDDFCLLAHYFGNSQYRNDTLWVKNHSVRIKGDTLLKSGMYILVNPQKARLIEFFVDQDSQKFTIESDTIDLMGHIKVTGSENNKNFYEWINFLNTIRIDGDKYREIVDSLKKLNNNNLADIYQKKVDSISNLHDSKWRTLFETNPNLLVSKFMNAQKEIPIPKYKKDGSEYSQLEKYYYMKDHYFDNIDLSDIGLLYTPIYHRKLSTYFEKIIQPIPDSVIVEGKKVFKLASNNDETRYYTTWFVSNFAESSKIMGMESAFVRFIDDFYASGAVDGSVLPALKESLIKRANELRHSLIGNIAPNIAAWDTTQRIIQLNQIQADYTFVFFFSTICSHCKEETKKLKTYYTEDKSKYKFEIFAVCVDSSFTQFKDYIHTNKIPWLAVNGTYTASKYYNDVYDVPTTPTLYLLDKNKKIIAKHLSADKMMEYMKEYDKAVKEE